jgi:hypothetical protein
MVRLRTFLNLMPDNLGRGCVQTPRQKALAVMKGLKTAPKGLNRVLERLAAGFLLVKRLKVVVLVFVLVFKISRVFNRDTQKCDLRLFYKGLILSLNP